VVVHMGQNEGDIMGLAALMELNERAHGRAVQIGNTAHTDDQAAGIVAENDALQHSGIAEKQRAGDLVYTDLLRHIHQLSGLALSFLVAELAQIPPALKLGFIAHLLHEQQNQFVF